MQIYIDMIMEKVRRGELDPTTLVASFVRDDLTKLDLLKELCNILQNVHYLAGANDLPLDDAYAALLTEGARGDKKLNSVDDIYRSYVEGKLRKSPSPSHAVFARLDAIENGIKHQLLSAQQQGQ